jgi:hypothetical protein
MEKADEPIAAPRGRESRTPRAFPLQTGRFPGTTTGGHDGDRGPSGRRRSAASPAVVVGEGHAPVVAVLAPGVNEFTTHESAHAIFDEMPQRPAIVHDGGRAA